MISSHIHLINFENCYELKGMDVINLKESDISNFFFLFFQFSSLYDLKESDISNYLKMISEQMIFKSRRDEDC